MNFNAKEVKDECVEWIRDWFERNGKDCNAVIGISGGKDSTVAAALCVEALGKDRVFGVMMPNGYQSDLEDAKAVCRYLDIKFWECNIKEIYEAFEDKVAWVLGAFRSHFSEQSKINLPPRIRMAVLYFVSQSINGRVVNTCNYSESFLGYSTRWGDDAGDFSPLGALTSDEVIAIGDELGLPYELVHKAPADGLCGKTDEDNFGFTYEALNKYIRTGECDDEEVKEKILKRHRDNLFKVFPIPEFYPGCSFFKDLYEDDDE